MVFELSLSSMIFMSTLQVSISSSSPAPTPRTLDFQQTKQLHARLLRTHYHPRPSANFNALITSYINSGAPSAAFQLYASARSTGTCLLDTFIVPSVLKACARLFALRQGMEVHGFALKSGLAWDVFVHNALIGFYSECGSLESAHRVFEKMPHKDEVSWRAMIRAFGRCGSFTRAVGLVREMLLLGTKPPGQIAVIHMLNLFADMGSLAMGRPLHAYLLKNGGTAHDDRESPSLHAATALLDMYAKCGSIGVARRVFDSMTTKSIASWTAMIAGHLRSKELEAGMELFMEMQREGVRPNEITMLSLVSECGLLGISGLGKWLHACILRNGFEIPVVLATALVDMYCKCSETKNARAFFERMEDRDIMSWTAMISGYARSSDFEQAFEIFGKMKEAGVRPNRLTMVSLVSLCAEAGALDRGRWLCALIDRLGIEVDVVLATTIIDMLGKCGDINGAYSVFDGAFSGTDRDVRMWNAMLNGFAMNGLGVEAIELFSRMEREGIFRPNEVTFIGLLRACSHSGLVEEGRRFFDQIETTYGVVPKVEHYGCMVDLLGRAGRLDEALELINKMPYEPNIVVWGALMAACRVHKNSELAGVAARELLLLEPHNVGYNVLLSNIYAAEKKWSYAAEIRKGMKEAGITTKAPGLSSIELDGLVYYFIAGDDAHTRNKEIRAMMSEMQRELKRAGHVADTSSVLQNVDDEEKEIALSYHSEKLAMAFGLIATSSHTPLRIVKNLRICNDCHAATKILSKIYGRVIIIRDRNRFHHFNKGICSCRDYW